ncbi:hypothetical protein Pelo_1592 [Pelomyxa schiedti]|nr:hypothetical protein Pelo_1592 [Pelomyxa schiedti]
MCSNKDGHVELTDISVVGEQEGSNENSQWPEGSLVPCEFWNKCCVVFNGLPKKARVEDVNLVSIADAKAKWRATYKGATLFKCDCILSMLELKNNGMMSVKSFVLGCYLLSKCGMPEHCTVQQYRDSGFKGSDTLYWLCSNEQDRHSMLRCFGILLVVNLFLSIASISYWATSVLGILTLGNAIFLHLLWHRVLFIWSNEHLSGSTLGVAIFGCACLIGGFVGDILMGAQTMFWYLYLGGFGLLQVVYAVLSTIFLANICCLLHKMSLKLSVPVPEYSVCTSLLVAGIVFVSAEIPAFMCALIFGIWFGANELVLMFCTVATLGMLPVILFVSMACKRYPSQATIPGITVSSLLVVLAVMLIVLQWTGHLVPYDSAM